MGAKKLCCLPFALNNGFDRMYLFVFIFVILSVLGLFTEVYTLRIASIVSKQRVVADTMMHWHGATYLFARDYIGSITLTADGCLFTIGQKVCGTSTQLFDKGPIAGGRTYLPNDYNTADAELIFNSRIYTAGGSNYILTYVDGIKLGYRPDQIYQQMFNTEMPLLSFGQVITGTCIGSAGARRQLATQQFNDGRQVCYPVPATIPDGAVGIISSLGS